MASIWEKETQFPTREPLSGDKKAEVVVIGGGMAGILIAYFLKQQGLNVVVLEKDRVGSGQTKNTTAKITAQHHLLYNDLIRQFGKEKARQYAHANQEAIGQYRRLVEALAIDCAFEEKSAYLYTTGSTEAMEKEAAAAELLDFEAALVKKTMLPFPVTGALRFDRQAQFQPLLFLRAVSAQVPVYEQTEVLELDGHQIKTNHGIITADKIVFACHFPFVNIPGYYFLRMYQQRSYVLALKGAGTLDGMYLDVAEGGLSLRSSGPFLLLGGRGHRCGVPPQESAYAALREEAARWFPDGREVAAWSAQDCMSLDGVPYIGPFSSTTPDWYVATGFNKWGMTSSMVAATILSALVTGQEAQNASVFSPQRFKLSASAKTLAEDSWQMMKGLTKEVFFLPLKGTQALDRGQGAVLDYAGHKAGAYKDPDGNVFVVSARCPHLGCQLTFNPDECSWDCPCHGSRFDIEGRRIGGPAQQSLDRPVTK